MTTIQDRCVPSGLVHRFNVGPKPGEFMPLLNGGLDVATTTVRDAPSADPELAHEIGFVPTEVIG